MTDWSGHPEIAFLVSKEEDRFTEYLCQLLKDGSVLRIFLAELCGVTIGRDQDLPVVRTQVMAAGGRPDLVIRDDPYLYVLIEAKVGSWFHEGQIVTYGRELLKWKEAKPDGEALLCLLCPQRTLTTAVSEAEEKLQEASIPITLMPIAWEQIGKLFAETHSKVSDDRLAFHILEFARLVEWRLGKEARPFTHEETQLLLDPLTGVALEKVTHLVDAVEARLSTIPTANTGTSNGKGYNGYGLVQNGRRWWFGSWYEIWSQARTPFVMQLKGFAGMALPEIPAGIPEPIEVRHSLGLGRDWVIPFRVWGGVEVDVAAERYVDWITTVCELFPRSGQEV